MLTPRAKVVTGIAAVLLLLAIALFFFLRFQIRKSFPPTGGTETVAPLAASVTVVRDTYGVPLITAASERDMIIAQGYVQAQDRLWQMELTRRAASGRLSELFGPETVPFDRMFRVAGLRRAAERSAAALPSDTREYLEWYTEGVNSYLKEAKGKLPVEFDLLRFDPEPWSVSDCLLIGKMMAWELNLAWWTDLTMGAIAERVGLQRAVDLVPDAPPGRTRDAAFPEVPLTSSLTRDFRATGAAYLRFRGGGSFGTGSNAWVVAPPRSASGKVILANDTHLLLAIPPHWHEIQLRAPEYAVGGMSIPGAPGVVAGSNDSIAWGVTNLMSDDADFYVEQIDSTGTRSLRDGNWVPMQIREELIGVRGDSAVSLTIRETVNGPIVTDVPMPLRNAVPPYAVSMRWMGAEADDQFGAFRRIDRAGNWEEFREGIRRCSVPGLNFVYGDHRGHIGYQAGVRIPIRGGKQSPLLPVPGWESSLSWKGIVPFEALPRLFDPPEGFVASANNQVKCIGTPHYITSLWEPSARYDRLREVLGRSGEVFSVADFQRLQNDTYSPYAREIVPYIMAAFADTASQSEEDRAALEYLRNWNYYFTPDDIATSIYQVFLVHLIRNTMGDELGEELLHDWVMLVNVPLRVIRNLLEEGTSVWFDDVRTAGVEETRDVIVRKSLRDAMAELRERLGADRKLWRWGEIHTVTLKHPFGLRKPLDRIFNLGPFPAGGASTALMSGEYSLNDPYAMAVGASFRQIFDLGNPAEVRAILPSGESGQVFHPNYDDQVRLWLNGGMRIVRRDSGYGGRRLLLEPSR